TVALTATRAGNAWSGTFATTIVLTRAGTHLDPCRLKRARWTARMTHKDAVRAQAAPDAAILLQCEHAVVRVLAAADSEDDVYPALLTAIEISLGLRVGEGR